MKRGNEWVLMLRSGIGAPGERIVDPISEKKSCACYPQMSLFFEVVDSESGKQDNTGPEFTVELDAPLSERSETRSTGKVTRGSVGVLAKRRIPKIINKKVRAEGRVPRTLVLRSRSAGIVEEPEKIQPVLPLAVIEEQERPAAATPLPTKVVVTVVPTPRKARARSPKTEGAAIPPAPVAKPLKVIRRRREESPKVFETSPKSLPRAMLEGIDIELGETNHGQID